MSPEMSPIPKIRIENLSFCYGLRPALRDISTQIMSRRITAVLGPSGQGKSTLLMTLNRLWENTPGARMTGTVRIRFKDRFEDIYGGPIPLHRLRRRVGMVFQIPNPLPMSIYKNAAFPLKLAGENRPDRIEHLVSEALRRTFLWEEVKDRLADDARTLSGGQQQRLCIARAMILEPDVLLLDEPTSSLDNRSGAMIEDLLLLLRKQCTLVMVSHYMDQVMRVADSVMEIDDGRLVEHR